MRSPARTAWSAIALSSALLLAGCGTQVDLAKVTHSRTVVPAKVAPRTTQPTGPARPVEPAFAVEKQRLIDPCGLLEQQVLAQFGTPVTSRPSGFADCGNYMKDGSGKSLSITVRLGQDMLSNEVSKATKKVGGLNASESTSGSSCFVRAVTQEAPRAMGITIQVSYEGDGCDVGRRLGESVINKIRTSPPLRTPEKGSLTVVDPCTSLPQNTPIEQLGGVPSQSGYGLYQCNWRRDDTTLGVEFSLDSNPKDRNYGPKPEELTLDGVTVYQRKEESYAKTCKLEWLHRDTGGGKGEVVEVKVDSTKKSDVDLCGKAVASAKALLPKLPKP
ncbi:hypothetical protein [Allokutzneria oryzae]|uniref:DUF3558 domain-containing protein n=1 Tax=Allokutzneria oryzae TaxID=1378989 RepID=A0ABV5ZYD4_9PSEU